MAHADERRRGGLRALGQRPCLLLVTAVAMVGALSLLSGPAVARHGPDFRHGGGAGGGPGFAPHWNGPGFGGPGWGQPWHGALNWRRPAASHALGAIQVAAGVSGTHAADAYWGYARYGHPGWDWRGSWGWRGAERGGWGPHSWAWDSLMAGVAAGFIAAPSVIFSPPPIYAVPAPIVLGSPAIVSPPLIAAPPSVIAAASLAPIAAAPVVPAVPSPLPSSSVLPGAAVPPPIVVLPPPTLVVAAAPPPVIFAPPSFALGICSPALAFVQPEPGWWSGSYITGGAAAIGLGLALAYPRSACRPLGGGRLARPRL
jgi:hypothetical protein